MNLKKLKILGVTIIMITIINQTTLKKQPYTIMHKKNILKNKIKLIPNLLSYSRIFFTILIDTSMYYKKINYALIFVLLASISDFLDGYIARKFNVTSEYGGNLDLFADKVFSINMLIIIFFNTKSQIIRMMLFLILSKEIVLVIIRNIYKKEVIFSILEKIKATILYISYILYFIHDPSHKICLTLGGICSALSQTHYIMK